MKKGSNAGNDLIPITRGVCWCDREDVQFGENGSVTLLTSKDGSVISEMDDVDLQIETRSRHPELVTLSLLVMVIATSATISHSEKLLAITDSVLVVISSLIFATGLFILASMSNYHEAVANGEIGSKHSTEPFKPHITGLGGFVALLLILLIALIFIMGQKRPYDFAISSALGNTTYAVLASIVLWVTLSSRIHFPRSITELLDDLRMKTSGFSGFGYLLSKVDAILIFGVAPLAGITLERWLLRYAVFFSQVTCGALLTWFAPAPIGIAGTFWVFCLTFSVVRRWGWIEHIRINSNRDPGDEGMRHIKKIVDLRDEAMLGLMLLILVMPISMRHVHLISPIGYGFEIDGENFDNLLAWTGFFGVELLKALPFLDWADIYGATNNTPIHATGPISMHAVFIARMIIDLVFLAALVQWISISVSIEKNKRDFLAQRNDVTYLDQRIARSHLRRLITKNRDGHFVATDALHSYAHYDPVELSRLKIKHREDLRLRVAIKEIGKLTGNSITSPSEQFMEESMRPNPSKKKLNHILDAIEAERDFELDSFLASRESLNWKGNLEQERVRLVRLIVRNSPPSNERDRKFAELLSGKNYDSLRGVRKLVVDTLVRNARRNPYVIDYLFDALRTDPSKPLQSYIERTMARFGLLTQMASDISDAA